MKTEEFTRAEIEAGRRLFAGDWQFVAAAGIARVAAADARRRDRLRRPLQCRQIEPDQRADRPQKPRPHLAHARPHPGTDFLHRRRRLNIVDMPGYGYAAAAKSKIAAWTALIDAYSARPRQPRPRLCAGRRPPRPQRHRRPDLRGTGPGRRQPSDRPDQSRRHQAVRA